VAGVTDDLRDFGLTADCEPAMRHGRLIHRIKSGNIAQDQ
jgi:hypothetical protein